MRTVAKCAAIASAVLLTGAAGASAQGYGTNQSNFGNQGYTQGYGTSQGNFGNQSYNQGLQGNQGYNQGLNNAGDQGANAGTWGNQRFQGANANWGGQGWNQGMQGSSSPYAENTGAGYANQQELQQRGLRGNIGMSPLAARDELLRYCYTDIRNLHPARGWSADAMQNGQSVHVMLGERGMVATFRGVDPNGWAASRNNQGQIVEGTPGYPGPRPDGNVQ
jgi:hypothetical protein